MELSERYIQKFEDEGFATIYEQQDKPGTVLPERTHPSKVSFFVTDGSATFTFGGEVREVKASERLDIISSVPYSITVGPHGWIAIVAEEVRGDS
jgi:hypothetical protein